jgi:hypothetical protein
MGPSCGHDGSSQQDPTEEPRQTSWQSLQQKDPGRAPQSSPQHQRHGPGDAPTVVPYLNGADRNNDFIWSDCGTRVTVTQKALYSMTNNATAAKKPTVVATIQRFICLP